MGTQQVSGLFFARTETEGKGAGYLFCSPEVPGTGGLRMLSNNPLLLDNGGGSSCIQGILNTKLAETIDMVLSLLLALSRVFSLSTRQLQDYITSREHGLHVCVYVYFAICVCPVICCCFLHALWASQIIPLTFDLLSSTLEPRSKLRVALSRGPPRRVSAYEISKSTEFHVDFGFQIGFLDFTWISGFHVDFWISKWISGFHVDF